MEEDKLKQWFRENKSVPFTNWCEAPPDVLELFYQHIRKVQEEEEKERNNINAS